MNAITKIHSLLAKVGACLQSPVLLVIRLFWGWQFILAGKGKLMHLAKTTEYFASLGIPAPKLNAIAASSTEVIGGALLLIGLFSRFSSLALMGVMSVALWTAFHGEVVGIFSDPDKFLAADPFLFLYAAILVFAFGPGKISLDALIGRETKA